MNGQLDKTSEIYVCLTLLQMSWHTESCFTHGSKIFAMPYYVSLLIFDSFSLCLMVKTKYKLHLFQCCQLIIFCHFYQICGFLEHQWRLKWHFSFSITSVFTAKRNIWSHRVEEGLRWLRNKVTSELITYYCLKSQLWFELWTAFWFETVVLYTGFTKLAHSFGKFLWGTCAKENEERKKLFLDCLKFHHFLYDLSNLCHVLPLQSAFLFTLRDCLSEKVKGLHERKDWQSFTKDNTVQTRAELNY